MITKDEAAKLLREIREERAIGQDKPLSQAEYKLTLDTIGLLAKLTLRLDFGRFLLTIDRAETLGPFVDPTLYRNFLFNRVAQADLEAAKGMASALSQVQKEAEKLLEACAA